MAEHFLVQNSRGCGVISTPLTENFYNFVTCLQDKVQIVTISGISDTM